MAEIFDFNNAREKRDNPENLKTGDICHLKITEGRLSQDKVRVVSIAGQKAVVRLLVGLGANVDGLAWYKLQDGTRLDLNFDNQKEVLLKNLARTK